MIIIIESIILCLIFTFMVSLMTISPLKTLYNYPKKIQERVKSLKEYQGKIPTTKNMLLVKITVSILIIIIISLILRYINGYQTFNISFKNSLLIWTIVNLYDVLILDIGYFCHSKKVIIKGTEDMKDEYHNYLFHIKEGLIGEFIGLILCLIISLIVTILP